jgi:diguanylate cyclase (GGDEF)-like protein/PAS domain S-box-containing protein
MRVVLGGGRGKGPPARSHRFFSLEGIVLVAALLSACAFYFREPMTTRQLRVGPVESEAGFQAYQYGDEGNGGRSVASAEVGRPFAWSCNLATAIDYPYCGFGLLFDLGHSGRGLDLSRFETVRISLSYQGPGRSLRVVMADQDSRYTALGAPTNQKTMQTSVAVSPGSQSVELRLDQFSVAEWWKNGASRPELAVPDFDNIVKMEILTGVDAPAGQHRVVVSDIVLEGKIISVEAFVGGILLAWLLLIASLLWQRRREAARWQAQLARSFQTTLDTIPHLVWSLDQQGLMHFNERWEGFTGIPRGPDSALAWWDLVHPDEVNAVIAGWNESVRRCEPFEIECRMKDRTGAFRWILARAVPSLAEDGVVVGWYGTCTDIHDRVTAQRALVESIANERLKSEQLQWVSEHDSLTGLPNRRAFQARLEDVTLRAIESGAGVGLLLIDLDHFKHVNDSFGHSAGDDLLKALAGRLRETLGRGDFVARLGGDEFAILTGNVQVETDLAAIGGSVLGAIQAPIELSGRTVRPGASIGGAMFPKDSRNPADFVKAADAALYALKRAGRGGFSLFRSYMLEGVEKAALQLARAREVVAENSVVAHYQPIVALDGGAIVGFEALLRYRTTGGGLGLPESLEEAFNDYDLAAKIGELMQRAVARDVRTWLAAGLGFERVSINAAPAEFLRDDYAERLLRVLAQHDVPPACIGVEVTEHAFLDRGPEYAARALHALKAAGVTVSLDDFGTGYSSLSHMRDFPVDVIKIDQSFVQRIGDDKEIAALVAGVVHLARSLGLHALGEGVETAGQLQLLRAMGCQFAQGHLIGRPVESARVAAFLSAADIPVAAV